MGRIAGRGGNELQGAGAIIAVELQRAADVWGSDVDDFDFAVRSRRGDREQVPPAISGADGFGLGNRGAVERVCGEPCARLRIREREDDIASITSGSSTAMGVELVPSAVTTSTAEASIASPSTA